MSMANRLALKLSRGVLSTIQPPVPRAKTWALAYPSTPARPLLDMSQGVPGNPPQDVLLEALAKTSSSPQSTGYCHVLGEPQLRSAFALEMKTVYGQNADVTAEDIAITSGCNMAFIASVMCLADPGDEVILPVPWYFNHSMSLNLLGITPVPLYTRSDRSFLPSADKCETLITPKTKAIVLVTPNNPTGAIYSPALIAEFAELARKKNIALIIDETYRDFVENLPPHNLFSLTQTEILSPSWSWRSNFIHLFSFSKSYGFPGHRLGLAVASPEFLKHLTTTLDCLQICPPRPPQLALANSSLLSQLRSAILLDAEALRARHELFRKYLPSDWIIGSQGGYFAFVKHPFVRIPALEFCQRLAQELGVLVLPAQFFWSEQTEAQRKAQRISEDGWDRWIRFSVANVDDEQIVKACERLRECHAHFA